MGMIMSYIRGTIGILLLIGGVFAAKYNPTVAIIIVIAGLVMILTGFKND